MTGNVRKPKPGDLVIVHCITLDEDFVGTVVDVLDTQFTYSIEMNPWDSYLRFASFTDDWKDYDPTPD